MADIWYITYNEKSVFYLEEPMEPRTLLDEETCHNVDHLEVDTIEDGGFNVIIVCTCGQEFEYTRAEWEALVDEIQTKTDAGH